MIISSRKEGGCVQAKEQPHSTATCSSSKSNPKAESTCSKTMTFQSTDEEMGFFLLAYKIGQVGFSCVSEIRHHVVPTLE